MRVDWPEITIYNVTKFPTRDYKTGDTTASGDEICIATTRRSIQIHWPCLIDEIRLTMCNRTLDYARRIVSGRSTPTTPVHSALNYTSMIPDKKKRTHPPIEFLVTRQKYRQGTCVSLSMGRTKKSTACKRKLASGTHL